MDPSSVFVAIRISLKALPVMFAKFSRPFARPPKMPVALSAG